MIEHSLKITACRHAVCTPRWSTYVELKVPHFRIYYVSSGAGMVTVCDKDYKLEPGFIYFVPGNQPFINHCAKRMEVLYIHGVPTTMLLESLLSKVNVVLKWNFAELALFNAVLDNTNEIDLKHCSSNAFELYALVYFIIAKVLNMIEVHTADAQLPNELKNALEFINSHYTRNPALQEIAKHANYAPIYFHRLFKLYFKASPHQYMERKRMTLAHDLLMNSARTIAEIAEVAGYQNVFYFSQVFKKHFSISPGMMRKHKMQP